ncbi:MAG: cobalt-precorrin-5B (C(1))-methyltransferase, partial [Selenomonas sp.]|nr:cobalt-precorrin-5B (C(1))-methyltransferase [Selenomonas sp.]
MRCLMKQLRSGYTTGACAAAGVKAALLYEQGEDWDSIELRALDGTELLIPVKNIVKDERGITAEVVKFSGDDPDITN